MNTVRNRSIKASLARALIFVIAAPQSWLLAQALEPAKRVKYAQISPADLKEWLSYLASDELQGRQVFTEGYGLAASYIAEHLRQWGIKPLGEHGTYFQNVKLKGYRVTRNSTVDVIVNGETKTFRHGDHVTFAPVSGGKQTLTFTGIEFIGYGTSAADLSGRTLKDKLVAAVPNLSPQSVGTGGATPPGAVARALGAKAFVILRPAPTAPTPAEAALARAQAALAQAQDAVTQAQSQLQSRAGGSGAESARARSALPTADITTALNVEAVLPVFTGDEAFFDALFGSGPVNFADVLAKAQKGEPIPSMTLPARAILNIDNMFEVVSEQLTRNVVGLIEGSDPNLKDTYVMFGAHLDHIGYSQTGESAQPSPSRCRRRSVAATDALEAAGRKPQNSQSLDSAAAAAARNNGGAGPSGGGPTGAHEAAPAAAQLPFDQRDLISNGADDDGSGSAAELAVAKALATGPRPKRSILFVWHTGEEAGYYGSGYNADFPVVPLDKVQVVLNMDMVGRDDCNNLEGDYTNTLFMIGDDRISSDLHNLIVNTNNMMAKPLTLDYELNDPNDPEGLYNRSDHALYAAKGIPIAYFTTGLHPDYHRVTDTVDKIMFPKMARIAQLAYETGFSIADTDKVLIRDNKGPRAGFGSKAEVIKK